LAFSLLRFHLHEAWTPEARAPQPVWTSIVSFLRRQPQRQLPTPWCKEVYRGPQYVSMCAACVARARHRNGWCFFFHGKPRLHQGTIRHAVFSLKIILTSTTGRAPLPKRVNSKHCALQTLCTTETCYSTVANSVERCVVQYMEHWSRSQEFIPSWGILLLLHPA